MKKLCRRCQVSVRTVLGQSKSPPRRTYRNDDGIMRDRLSVRGYLPLPRICGLEELGDREPSSNAHNSLVRIDALAADDGVNLHKCVKQLRAGRSLVRVYAASPDDRRLAARMLRAGGVAFSASDGGASGQGQAPRLTPLMTDAPLTSRLGLPGIGEHTADALAAAGYSEGEIRALVAEGAVALGE
jgi:hypothetical protein